jgi:hypothetical protein
MKLTNLTPAHAIKLASLAVHAEEMLETMKRGDHAATQFDEQSIRGLLSDPQVREVLDDRDNAVFLPVKR